MLVVSLSVNNVGRTLTTTHCEIFDDAPVAQWLVHCLPKAEAVGSSPTGGSDALRLIFSHFFSSRLRPL